MVVHGSGVGGEGHAVHVGFDGGDVAGDGGRAWGGRVLSVSSVVGVVVVGRTGVGIGVVVVVGRTGVVVGGVGRGIVEVVEVVGHFHGLGCSAPCRLPGSGVAWLLRFRILTVNGLVFQTQVAYIIPIVGVIFGYLIMDETITWKAIVSLCLIIFGIYIVKNNNKGLKK